MSTERAFLDEILEHPDDDTPRLIYADWLEDNGDPDRAEFIRVQCQLARMDGDDPAGLPLRDREAELLLRHEDEWRAGLPEGSQFERGFVAEVFFRKARQFLDTSAELACAGPWHRLNLYGPKTEEVAELLEWPGVARLTGLALVFGYFGPEGAQLVAECPRLARLRRLTLTEDIVGDEGACALAGSPYLNHVTHLGLEDCSLSAAGIDAVLRSPTFSRLTSLDLDSNGLDPETVAVLADAPRLEQLHTLRLGNQPLGREGLRQLIDSGRLGRLECLDLRSADMADGVDVLAGAKGLDSLTDLDLQANRLDAGAVAALGRSPALPRLRVLYLANNPLGDAGAFALARSGWRSLSTLHLANCDITDMGLSALVSSPALASLRKLLLWDARRRLAPATSRIGPDGAGAIARSTILRRLEDLDLSYNTLGDAGARMLAESELLPSLRVLGLSNNNIGDEGALALARSPHLGRLHSLKLGGNPISPDVQDRLRARFGRRVYL